MGKFFNTLHVKADNKDGFVNAFEQLMKKNGYVPCSEDEAALSYAAAFSEGGWVTLSNGDDSMSELTKLSAKIARDMKTSCFTAEAVDSDFAILELHAPSGRKSRVVVGDGEGYGVGKAPFSADDWKPLLQNGDIEKFLAVIGQDSTFVEDDLVEIGGLLGISGFAMTANHDELSENESAFSLSFKKAAEKKLTLNTAFVKVFGEGLEPLGFRRLKNIKNKHPYFARVVGGELLQIVTFRQVGSTKTGYKNIEILGGIVTLYRRNLDFIYFTNNPQDWLRSNGRFWRLVTHVDQNVMERTIQYTCNIWGVDKNLVIQRETLSGAFSDRITFFLCKADDNEALLLGIQHAFEVTKNVMLAVMEQITTLNSCVEYFYKINERMGLCPFDEFVANDLYSYSEGLALVKAGYRDDGVERLRKQAEAASRSLGCKSTPENIKKAYDEYIQQHENHRAEQVALRNMMLDDPELNKRVLAEMERCKANNIELLKSYGIIID